MTLTPEQRAALTERLEKMDTDDMVAQVILSATVEIAKRGDVPREQVVDIMIAALDAYRLTVAQAVLEKLARGASSPEKLLRGCVAGRAAVEAKVLPAIRRLFNLVELLRPEKEED